MNKSAASAASLDYINFEAVIKSAASAASRKTNPGRFPESWSPGFGLPVGCASSRLDHGFQIPSITMRSGITWQICIPKMHPTRENDTQGLEKTLGLVPDLQNLNKNMKKFSF